MSVVDYILNSLITKLQKTQKARKRKKKTRRKPVPSKRPKKKTVSIKRRPVSQKARAAKKAPKKALKKPVKKKKAAAKAKKKPSAVPRKSGGVLKTKKNVSRSGSQAKTARAKKAAAVKVSPAKSAVKEICIGEITHYFSRIQVVVLKMEKGSLSVGDHIHIKGRGVDFTQKAGSLQIESIDVKTARKGKLVGLKVDKAVKVGSKVLKSISQSA